MSIKVAKEAFITHSNNMSKITIEIDKAETVSHNLADLLCWWEGFKMGLKAGDNTDHFMIAENGIEAARDLNCKIRDQINKIQTVKP